MPTNATTSPAPRRESIVARAQVALSAINALAVHLGSLTDRRKTLIVASDGVGRADHRRGQEYLPTLDTIIRSANRSNVAVYPFDPRDGAEAPVAVAELRRLADETDGEAIAADAEPGLRRVTADSSAYYLLSFRTAHPDDGQFRELHATVKRPGAVVRARKGYWTASPDEAMRAALIAKANEPKVVVPLEPAPHASTLIRPWFGMGRGEAGKTRVTFVWEPAAHVPGDRVRRTVSKLEFQARAADGTVLFRGPVAPTGPAAVDEPAATPARAVFDDAAWTAASQHVDSGRRVHRARRGRARDVDPRSEGRGGGRHAGDPPGAKRARVSRD